MSLLLRHGRLLAALVALLGLASCGRNGNAIERAQVKSDFETFRQALLTSESDRIMEYLPQDVGGYLVLINGGNNPVPAAAAPPVAGSPDVNLLLRTVLKEKMSPELRAHLSLQLLLQRLGDRGLLDCREIRGVSLGSVAISGKSASAELYFQGDLLPLRVPFIKQAGLWKVDLLSMLPYAEVLMRLDRAVTGKSQSQQVAQIVAPLPLL